MLQIKNTLYALILIMISAAGCKEKYNPDIPYPNSGYLVVEGFINSGKGATNIKLSRTVKLKDSTAIRYEQGARVTVEGNDNSSYTLLPQLAGLYTISQLTLNDANQYRLRIKTTDNKEYLSPFTSIIRTPPIDSISWTREAYGVQLNINTHDPKNKTWYYTWNFEETWEFRARYLPVVKYVTNANGRITGVTQINPPLGLPDTSGFRCWQFNNSTEILTGSSIKLSQDVIHLPLWQIEKASWKLGELYSIKVYEHGVSAQGYEFLQRMRKNTQQLGSIFDSQPSELNSNIHNTSNPTEPVIGFIDVADAQEVRIFITPQQVPAWGYALECEEKYIPPTNGDSLEAYSFLSPIDLELHEGTYQLHLSNGICVDCKERGTNKKPSYWPR